MIMTATSAAMGMTATMSPSATTSVMRNTPARNVDSRVRAPLALTLIIVCPIIAQPPMPPKKPVTMFATPWPQDSRVLFERVSVMSSTNFAVISDSIRPTNAIARAKGAMMRSVSKVNGTAGIPRIGKPPGSSPWSPTVGTFHPNETAAMVRSTTATRGAGTAVVNRGRTSMITMPTTTIG